MNYENILFDITDGVATLTLNRPDKLNSFTQAMHEEVRHAMHKISSDKSVRVMVLTDAGRGFCAGQDLSDRSVEPGARPVDLGDSVEKNYAPLVLALRALPMPVICAVNGVAAGAGANIALACDIVLAAKSASFVEVFCKLVDGKVDMDVNYALEDYEIARGFVLSCQSFPVTDKVVVDFDQAE